MAGELSKLWADHPEYVAIGAVALGGLVIWYYLGRSSSSGAVDTSGYYAAQANSIASGNQLAAIMAQVQAAGNAVAGRVAIADTQAAATAAIAKVQADASVANTASTNTAQVDIARIQGSSTDLANQLSAGVQTNRDTLAADTAKITAQLANESSDRASNNALALGITQSNNDLTLGVTQANDTLKATIASITGAEHVSDNALTLGTTQAFDTLQAAGWTNEAVKQAQDLTYQFNMAKESDATAVALAKINTQSFTAQDLQNLAFWRPGAASNVTFDPSGNLSTLSIQTPASYPGNVIPFATQGNVSGTPYVGPAATIGGTA